MDLSQATTLTTTVGFPIVCCLGLAWYVKDTTNAIRQDAKEDKERMYQQLDRFGDTLDKVNTNLEKLNSGKGVK